MTRASLAAFKRTITVDWARGMDKAARAHLVSVARAGHARIMQEQTARSGIAPTFEAFANQPGKPVEAVVLPGPIVYRYGYLREVIVAALNVLRAASPVRSGAYRNSHTLFIDGVAVSEIPSELPRGADIMIANPLPYSRRLEIGKTKSGRAFVIQVPDRIYERTAKKVLQPKYRNVAKIDFSYATLPHAHTIKGGLSPTYGIGGGRVRKRQQHRNVGKAVQSPAIVIKAI